MTKEIVLSLKNVQKTFGGTPVLKSINLDVYGGQIIGYIGPNGAGKSTTVKLMLGLISSFEGEIEIFGENIKESGPAFKKRIGYVPENGEIYDNLTPMEYLSFVGGLYGMEQVTIEKKAKELMRLFELDGVLHTRISAFSKGMKQKLLLIASMIHNPDLLFLDEPLSGLDANSVMIVKEVMDQLASQGKTIFYSSHIMDVVEKISNRIVLLANGKIVADGTFEQLQQQNKEGTLEEIFNQLTGFDKHKEIACSIVSVVENGDTNE
ncbi:ABC transporter ATP-binding protein [Gracilibacillus sp. S3-1-1]|uniref:ABC transporter ATP-binding protein n=1 Tax=Gracilibacillus pellucidus TaxID=3095368 RepID=A0ACC6M0H0_9BACI|nr:ABC transporter ATP-binding protein [Gracilibacillus sp. S3-1-1]MDX8044430.1 ABC transporter ATP-binding protein [Gracilibacillus sp. S3-1-1]